LEKAHVSFCRGPANSLYFPRSIGATYGLELESNPTGRTFQQIRA
jgi:hypothetical protein